MIRQQQISGLSAPLCMSRALWTVLSFIACRPIAWPGLPSREFMRCNIRPGNQAGETPQLASLSPAAGEQTLSTALPGVLKALEGWQSYKHPCTGKRPTLVGLRWGKPIARIQHLLKFRVPAPTQISALAVEAGVYGSMCSTNHWNNEIMDFGRIRDWLQRKMDSTE
ncbi:hypothetical protein RRG08_038029 [Elysia crispata]|uniref:Uncharacterized protein n=1 Tax=Elysia crispata TaxID=231223 RepID=A0AAE1DP64_9GAST|nr:hypothetical protein RRG08_038029 [Elysia crispata]